jgi:ACT domain-containing protein
LFSKGVDKRTNSEHYYLNEEKMLTNLLEDILTVCTLLAMGTAIVMWGSIGQALAG